MTILDLPSGWGTRRLDDLLLFSDSGTWGDPGTPKIGLPVLRSTNIRAWKLDTVADLAFRSVPERDRQRKRLRFGDIIVTKSSGSPHLIGEAALFDVQNEDVVFLFSNFIQRLRPDPRMVSPRYLHYYLQSPAARNVINEMQRTTSGLRNLKLQEYDSQDVPIPYPDDPARSLAEQRRIVARLEALLGEVRELRQLQAEIEADVGRLMEAVLAEVFGEIESRHPGERPIHQLTSVTSGGTPLRSRSEYYEDGTIAWIKTGELRDNLVTEANEHITTLGLDNSSAKVFPVGTLLIAMYGQGQTRGRTGVLGIEAATNQACCAILPNPNEFESFYLQYWFRYMYQLLRAQTESHGGNQPNLSQTIIRELKPPLPNVEDQKHYVAHLKLIETEVDQLLGGQEHNNSLLDDLGQSILARAFLGEL